MQKDLVTLDNEQKEEFDKEFDELLQEFIDKEFDSDEDLDETLDPDDENQDDNTDTDDDTGQRNLKKKKERMENPPQTAYSLSVNVLEDCDKSCLCCGPVTVHLATDEDALPETNRFRCYIYTDTYFPMCSSLENAEVFRNGNELAYEMPCSRIWLPGNYILLVRDKGDRLLRMDFQLDDNLEARYAPLTFVPFCGIDDVLTDSLEKDDDWKLFAAIPGVAQMRKRMMESMHLSVYDCMVKGQGGRSVGSNRNLLISTRNKDLTYRELRHFRIDFGHMHSLEYVDCSTLYDATCVNPYEHLYELSIGSDTVCLTNLGALTSTGGKVIMRHIMRKVLDNAVPNPLWLCGSRQEIEALLDQFPSLKTFYTAESWVEQEPYSAFELVQAFFLMMQEENLMPSLAVMDLVSRAIISGHCQGRLANWSLSDLHRIITDDIRPRYTKRILAEFDVESLPVVLPEDMDMSLFTGGTDTLEACLGELHGMVGLDHVKQGIVTLANNTRFLVERRRRGLPTSGNIAYHAIFTGNPGTGKTTVARMLGRIYHSLGLLSRGEVMAVDRTRLVGRYIGETEENMKAVLEEARGNVLFIDEAYNLYDGSGDRKDFGARVIDSLLTTLSQPNPDMMVIFAGYEKEMDAMLNTNPGLMGRFPYKYRFSDYDPEQLMEIATRLLEHDAYILTDEAAAVLKESIAQTYKNKTTNFGNGRWVEQFVNNGIIPAMANRLAATPSDDYQHIEASDVRKAYEKFNPKATELKPRRQVGFSA